jgi:hypothetical protein
MLLICGAVAAGFAGAARAGEDSTHLWRGIGPAYYGTEGGLRRFAECGAQEPLPMAAPECAHAPLAAPRGAQPLRSAADSIDGSAMQKNGHDGARRDSARKDSVPM